MKDYALSPPEGLRLVVKLSGLLPLQSVVLLLSLREDEIGEDEGGHHGEERLPDSPEDVGQTYVSKIFVKYMYVCC